MQIVKMFIWNMSYRAFTFAEQRLILLLVPLLNTFIACRAEKHKCTWEMVLKVLFCAFNTHKNHKQLFADIIQLLWSLWIRIVYRNKSTQSLSAFTCMVGICKRLNGFIVDFDSLLIIYTYDSFKKLYKKRFNQHYTYNLKM